MRYIPAPFARNPNLIAALTVTGTLAPRRRLHAGRCGTPQRLRHHLRHHRRQRPRHQHRHTASAPRPGGLDRAEDPDRHRLARRVRWCEQRGTGAGRRCIRCRRPQLRGEGLRLDGAHRRTFGRQGDGPGEFQAFSSLAWAGDRLLTYDPMPGRVGEWSSEGDWLGQQRTRGLITGGGGGR